LNITKTGKMAEIRITIFVFPPLKRGKMGERRQGEEL